MNNEQSSQSQSPAARNPIIHWRGRPFTLKQAASLALQQQQSKDFHAAIAICDLIIARAPDYPEAHNNRGIILMALQRYAEALLSFDRATSLEPDHADAHNNRGAVLQQMNRHADALASFDRAIALNPDHARAHNNRSASLQVLERYEEALASCDRAIALKPDYASAHNNRGVALQRLKRYQDSLASFDRAIALNPNHPNPFNNRGMTLQELKRYDEAVASYDRAIALNPRYANAHMNRGVALHQLRQYVEALASYDRALALTPDHVGAHNNRGLTLYELGLFEEALASFNQAIAINPAEAQFHDNRGLALKSLMDFDAALASHDRAVALKPDSAESHKCRGTILITKGRMDEAEQAFLKALALKPGYPEPLCALASIRKYRDTGGTDAAAIQASLSDPATPADERDRLYFALGKIYDDCGLFDAAFESYTRANQLRSLNVSYDPANIEATTNDIMAVFTRDFLSRQFAFSSDSPSPVFVVGMPRSGTTLMASILSNHHSIATAGELPTILYFVAALPALIKTSTPYPQVATQITSAVAARITGEYLKRSRHGVGPEILHVVDKHPLNFWHLGLITMLFPKARIIHCRRHPLDTGLSNFFQRFALSYHYSFDLRNIGHYFVQYARIMDHWRKALPQPMIEVDYSDLVLHTEQTTRGILDSLRLDWDERCLAPHTNPASVDTSSRWQVRQPIYTLSLDRWRHYEKHLAPLKEILVNAGHLPV